MLEKPTISDEQIMSCLHDHYGITIARLEFLPIGADVDSAVYRATGGDSAAYFVKLRGGTFDAMTITVPKLLYDQGNSYVIAPFATRTGRLWTDLGDYKLAVFPFIEGRDGYDMRLTDSHWVEFGRALKAIHSADIPPAITDYIQRETFSGQWRETVRQFQRQAVESTFSDPVAAELATFLRNHAAVITQLIGRAESLAVVLRVRPQAFVLCHADLHAGNVLMDAHDHLYIIDWDTLIMAPVERDLMYVGGGQFVNHRSPVEEEALFYQGYGPTQPDPVGLAYYRYERIVQDIAAYCEEILFTEGDSADRANGLRQLMGQFQPGQVVEIAYRSENALPDEFRLK